MNERPTRARFALAILFGINLLNFFDRQIAGVLSEPIRLEFDLSDMALGLIATAFTLVYAAAGVPLGRLTDRWRRTHLISISVASWSLLTAAGGAAATFPQFVASRLGVGIGEAGCAPAGQSLIADLFPVERRARAMGIFMLGLPLGLVAAYAVGGAIGQAWGWRSVFYIACLPGFLLAALLLWVPEPARGGVGTQEVPAVKSPYRTLARIPTLRWIILSGIFINFNSYAIGIFQTPFLQRYHEIGLQEAGKVAAISIGVGGIAGVLGGGLIGDWVRAKRMNGGLLVATLALSVSAPCVYFALEQPKGGVGFFTLFMAISSAMNFMYSPTVYSALLEVVPAQLRGTAVAVYFLAMYVLGASFGATITGGLSDFFAERAMRLAGETEMTLVFKAEGLHTAMYLLPLLALLCALSLFGAAKSAPRDIARAKGQ